jgi:histidine kinase
MLLTFCRQLRKDIFIFFRMNGFKNGFHTGSKANRISLHIAFWIFAYLLICLYYISTPGPGVLMATVAYLLPVHIAYFYYISYRALPSFLHSKNYFSFLARILAALLIAALAFRCIEILLVVPLIERALAEQNPGFVWAKAQGTVRQQFFNREDFVNAIEQSNLIVWVAVSVKFFKMWLEKRNSALEAELNFLKSQVHPHFLFNTLNNLYALTLESSPRAPETVLGLSKILRYMLYECNNEMVSLSRDLEIVMSYIALEKIRFEQRLELNVSVNGDVTNHRIAPLLLLPLVENAFKHGAGEVAGDTWITIDLMIAGEILTCKVANMKPGKAGLLEKGNLRPIGLENLRKRLSLIYPGKHQFRVVEEDDTFIAVLKITL